MDELFGQRQAATDDGPKVSTIGGQTSQRTKRCYWLVFSVVLRLNGVASAKCIQVDALSKIMNQ